MSIIKVKCTDQVLAFDNTPVIASGGLEENFLQVAFCTLWDGFTRTAVFWRTEAEAYHVPMDDEDTCQVPPEVTDAEGVIYFGVFGVDAAGRQRTSNVLTYRVEKGAITTGTKPSDPTPDIYTALLAKYAEKIDWFAAGTSIPRGSDLSTYTTPGKYYFGSGEYAKDLGDCPVDNDNFVMFVFKRTTGSSLTQMIITLNAALYIRGSNSTGSLREWKKKPSLSEVLDLIAAITADDVGAIAKTDKPSGIYTGNGDTKERTINVGGACTSASVLSIVCAQRGYFCLLGRYGGIGVTATSGEIVTIPRAQGHFKDGVIIIATDSVYINGDEIYDYELL